MCAPFMHSNLLRTAIHISSSKDPMASKGAKRNPPLSLSNLRLNRQPVVPATAPTPAATEYKTATPPTQPEINYAKEVLLRRPVGPPRVCNDDDDDCCCGGATGDDRCWFCKSRQPA
jgi:hypothetical protein